MRLTLERALVSTLAGLALATAASAQSIQQVTFFGFGDGTNAGMSLDAAAGLNSILSGDDDYTYGLPLPLYRKTVNDGGLSPDVMWTVFGGLPSPAFRPLPDAPYPMGLQQSAFVKNGVELVNQNCFACHAGVVANQVVAGLGNMQVDGASFAAQAQQLLDAWDRPLLHFGLRLMLTSGEMDALSGYVDYLRTIVVPVVQAYGRGDNQGPWVVWKTIARMQDPASGVGQYPPGWTTDLEKLLDRPLPPVRPNPWWRLKYKERAFWTQDVSPHSLATFALNLMDPAPDNTATFPRRMETTRQKLEFARQTQPPPYPWRGQVNLDLAKDGYQFFHGLTPLSDGSRLPCSGCHGQYAEDGTLKTFPNGGTVSLDVLGTDPEYATILQGLLPLYEHFGKSPFKPTGTDSVHYPAVPGYAPPPLVGIWAAAPYFHNGSVPTVWAVLKSDDRPAVWRKSLDPRAYDPLHLGVAFRPLTNGQLEGMNAAATASGDPMSEDSLALRQVYSTGNYGKKNTGHTFGDRMTEAERLAVIEYLKLL